LFDAAEKIGLKSVEAFDNGAVGGVAGFNEHREILAIAGDGSDGPWAVNIRLVLGQNPAANDAAAVRRRVH
jgi:hypothetical protein